MGKLFRKTLELYLNVLSTTSRTRTVEIYRLHVRSLIRYLEKHYPEIDSFDKLKRKPHVEGWLQSLAQRKPPYRNITRRKYIRHVRRFLQDISDWDWPGKAPPGLIRTDDFPPRDQYLPKPLPPEVDAALIDALRKMKDVISLGLVLARWTGLRVGELNSLALDCLFQNTDERYSLRVPLGKLHNERVIPIDKDTAALVDTIQRKRGRRPRTVDLETGRPVELLLCNSKGQQIHRVTFNRKLQAVAKSIGITENVSPHRLRHTYATELLRCGVSLPGVMKLLGHKTLKMTLRYVAVTNEDLGKAYLEAATKARKRYALLNHYQSNDKTEESLESIETVNAAFDELVAQIQKIRFDHPHSEKRRKLQRLGERLRRMQNEVPKLLE